ncbi:MAG: holo-ACP synthase [Flaviflexus sp.]|nr:holo-ACP synthase [Flaviflexus sp.]
MILGIGMDLVHVPGFAAQLAQPGTAFARAFTGAEHRAAAARAAITGSTHPHLAARWAAKEAVIKAWSQALAGHPPPLADGEVNFADIEVRADAWGRPFLHIHPGLKEVMTDSITACGGPSEFSWHLSLSHDGEYASAYVLLTG